LTVDSLDLFALAISGFGFGRLSERFIPVTMGAALLSDPLDLPGPRVGGVAEALGRTHHGSFQALVGSPVGAFAVES
jgi:hypothetical protein